MRQSKRKAGPGLNNVLLPILLNVVNNIVWLESGVTMLLTILNNIVESESGVTMLNDIVDNCICRQ